jgi:hypothetical protein
MIAQIKLENQLVPDPGHINPSATRWCLAGEPTIPKSAKLINDKAKWPEIINRGADDLPLSTNLLNIKELLL